MLQAGQTSGNSLSISGFHTSYFCCLQWLFLPFFILWAPTCHLKLNSSYSVSVEDFIVHPLPNWFRCFLYLPLSAYSTIMSELLLCPLLSNMNFFDGRGPSYSFVFPSPTILPGTEWVFKICLMLQLHLISKQQNSSYATSPHK